MIMHPLKITRRERCVKVGLSFEDLLLLLFIINCMIVTILFDQSRYASSFNIGLEEFSIGDY